LLASGLEPAQAQPAVGDNIYQIGKFFNQYVCFPQPEIWLGFIAPQKQRHGNQEEKETSIEYFYDKV
jgi:hypothetical protein